MREISSGRRLATVVPHVKGSRIDRVEVHALSPVAGGIVVPNLIFGTNPTTARRIQGIPAKEGEGTETVLSYPDRCRTPLCTGKTGQRIRTLYPRRVTRENRFSLPLRSCHVRSSQIEVKKYPSTSPMTPGRSGGIVPTHEAKGPKKAWLPIARRSAPIARVVRKKSKEGYVYAVA